MNVILVGASALVGGMVAAVLGWLDSGEVFEARKFSASIVRALIAGLGIAAAYSYANSITVLDIVICFLAGAGFDAGVNRISGAIKASISPKGKS